MLTPEAVARAVDDLCLLRFAPGESSRPSLIRLLARLCADDGQLAWLAQEVLRRHDEWPGPRELRAMCEGHHTPADGIRGYLSNGMAVGADDYPEFYGVPGPHGEPNWNEEKQRRHDAECTICRNET